MLVPTLFVRDMAEAITFYTRLLDFDLASNWPDGDPFYAVLLRDGDELHLSCPGDRGQAGYGCAILVCSDVDALFASYQARGWHPPVRPESPVHEAPLDQTWGTREHYIDDPSGNTLILQQH